MNGVTINDDPVVEYDVTIPTGDGFKVTGEAKAKEKVAYTFTVAPADETYEIKTVTYAVGEDGEATPLDIAKDGKYTIPAEKVTGKIKIEVTAAKIQYTVTAVYTDGEVDYNAKEVSDGKIEAGKALEFTVSAKLDSKITEVSYTMGTEKPVVAKAEENGSYKVTIEKVTGNITITIKSVKIYTVTFPKGTAENQSEVTGITDIKIDGKDADTKSLGADDAKWEVSVENGKKISFKVSTTEFFQVNEVTFDGARAAQKVAVKDGVYSFTVRDNATLAIATELNPAKCGAFKVTVNGDEDSATATVKMAAEEKDDDEIAGLVDLGDKIVTRNKKVILAIAADTDYEISKVEVGGKVAEATTAATGDNPAEWEIELTAGMETAVVVTTTPKPTTAAGKIKVMIAEDAKEQLTDLTVKAVMANESKVLEPADGGVYEAPAGSKTVEITVTAVNGVKPSHEDPNLTGPAVATVSGKKTYTYTILASKLKAEEPDTVTFTKEDIKYSIDIEKDDYVDVSVSIDGQEITETECEAIPEGTTVAVRVEQADDTHPLNGVTYTVGNTAAKTVKASKGVAAFTVKMTGDVNVTVDTAEPYTAATLKDSENKVVPAVKGVYNVSYEGTYTVGLLQGDDPVEIADVKVLNGKTPVEDGVKIAGTATEAPTIKLSKDLAGKKLTVKLYVEDDYGDYVDTKADYTLQVAKVVSKITAPKTAKQPTDTTKTYKVTTDGELSKLSVKSSDTNVVSATWYAETGEVAITAGQTPGKADVTITDGEVSSKIEVTTEALISKTTAAPTVSLKSATDVELSLTVGAKNIADNLVSGAVWYQVEVKPQGEASAIPTGLKKTVDTKYVKKTGESQTIPVKVADGDLGTGHAWKYDVKVSLVHVKDKTKNFEGTEGDIVMLGEDKAQSNVFESGNKPFATLEPAWESNLKLKKGQVTLTTGEGNVTIATPQFSKPTTYKTLTVSDTSYDDNKALDVEVDVASGVIKASTVVGETAVGKHTIEVVAAANEEAESEDESAAMVPTMYASKATIVVTVVQGIDTLSVQLPSLSVYKAAGKPATLKATAVFNGDTTGKDKTLQPKAKNLKWEIVDTSDNAWPDNKITVKNGTVTIAKDYILKAGTNTNQFKIKVYADNSNPKKFVGVAGDTKKGAAAVYSDPITITNKGAQVAAVAIVAKNSEDKYEVIAKPGTSDVEATKISSGKVVAFTTTDIKETYEDDTALDAATVPVSNLTFKSNKAKNVAVDGNGKLTVNSTAKSVKLTVTANDGSKNKAELTLNVNPDPTTSKDLALTITTVDNGTVYTAPAAKLGDDNTVTVDPYSGSAVSRVKIGVLAWNEAADGGAKYEAVPRYANYTLRVKKGGKLSGPDSNGAYTATLDKRDIEIQLTNADNKTWTYKLTNKDILDTKALKITAKALNTLHPEGTKEEQKVTIQLSNVDQTKYDGCTDVYADVEVDWSKKNDKNAADLTFIAENLSESSKKLVDIDPAKKTAKLVLSFDNASHRFTQSSYALKVTLRGTKKETVGEKEVTEEKAVSQPAAVTVKVDKVKKFTFKPTTSYTIGSKDGYAVVSGKSSIPTNELNLKFEKLLNLADKNGQENKFTKNIELTEDGKLKIKTDAKADDLVAAHLTGYLVYTATTDAAYYNTKSQSGVVKITVKIKDNNSSIKYTHEAAEIGFKATSAATVAVKVNTKDAITAPDVTVKAAKVKSTKDPIEVTVADGKLVVTLKEDVDIKKTKAIKADIYIQTSENTATLTSDEDWSKKAAVVKLNLPVNATLKIEDTLKTAIQTAVTNVFGDSESQIKIFADTKWADIEEKVMAAAESALGEKSDFEVVADEKTALTIDETAKKATIKLTVRQKNLTSNSAEITVSNITVSEPETPAPAED